jgi:hypothetical protein
MRGCSGHGQIERCVCDSTRQACSFRQHHGRCWVSNRVPSARKQLDDILLRASTTASASYSASIISIGDGTLSLALSKYSARHAYITAPPYFLTVAGNSPGIHSTGRRRKNAAPSGHALCRAIQNVTHCGRQPEPTPLWHSVEATKR